MITIIDYGICNVNSIKNILKKIGYQSVITNNETDIKKASHLILPGVGSFDAGISNLEDSNLIDAIRSRVLDDGIPIMGICLGMQLLTKGSEEGTKQGLGWIDAYVHKFPKSDLKIPHMGWNYAIPKVSNDLMQVSDEWKFYFVHSYYVECSNEDDVIAKTKYGVNFCSAFQRDNIYGVQFHPEKSHAYGMNLLKAFIKNGESK